MNIELSENTKRLIDLWIESGVYRSPEEVIEAAVHRLGPAETPTRESLQAKIDAGLRDIEENRCGPLDIEQFLRDCHSDLNEEPCL